MLSHSIEIPCRNILTLTYLTGSVWPDIAMAVHQCARFSINPMRSHEQAVMRIRWYLLSTKGQGMIYRPDPSKSHWSLCWCQFCWRLGSCWSDECWVYLFKNWLCYSICWLPCVLAKQTSDWNCFIYSRDRVYGAISGIMGDSSNIKSDEENQCHLPTLSFITQVHYQNERGQSFLHCNCKQSKVLSTYKTHCN